VNEEFITKFTTILCHENLELYGSCDWEVTCALTELLISLHFECVWCIHVLTIELLPQDSEHASHAHASRSQMFEVK